MQEWDSTVQIAWWYCAIAHLRGNTDHKHTTHDWHSYWSAWENRARLLAWCKLHSLYGRHLKHAVHRTPHASCIPTCVCAQLCADCVLTLFTNSKLGPAMWSPREFSFVSLAHWPPWLFSAVMPSPKLFLLLLLTSSLFVNRDLCIRKSVKRTGWEINTLLQLSNLNVRKFRS